MGSTLKTHTKFVASLLCIAAAVPAFAMDSIDTLPNWNGSSFVGLFGETDTATFGQSITTDALGGLLKSFSFYLGPLQLDLRAYVAEWDGIKAVGTPLYTSQTFSIGESFTGFKEVKVDTGGVALKADTQYVLFFSTSGLQKGVYNTNNWAALTTNAYSGGEFVLHNSGDDLPSLFTDPGWDCGDGCGFTGNGADLVFKAQFDPLPAIPAVPEASTVAMLAMGLGIVSLVSRRQRRPSQG